MQRSWYQSAGVFGRLHHSGRLQAEVLGGHGIRIESAEQLGLDGQYGEVGVATDHKNGIPRFCNRHSVNAVTGPEGEEKAFSKRLQETPEAVIQRSEGEAKDSLGDLGKIAECSSGSTVFLVTSSESYQFGTESHRVETPGTSGLERANSCTRSSMRGASVVDRFSSRLERKLYHPEPNSSRRILRCLRYRVRGCLMMNAKHFGQVVQGHYTINDFWARLSTFGHAFGHVVLKRAQTCSNVPKNVLKRAQKQEQTWRRAQTCPNLLGTFLF